MQGARARIEVVLESHVGDREREGAERNARLMRDAEWFADHARRKHLGSRLAGLPRSLEVIQRQGGTSPIMEDFHQPRGIGHPGKKLKH